VAQRLAASRVVPGLWIDVGWLWQEGSPRTSPACGHSSPPADRAGGPGPPARVLRELLNSFIAVLRPTPLDPGRVDINIGDCHRPPASKNRLPRPSTRLRLLGPTTILRATMVGDLRPPGHHDVSTTPIYPHVLNRGPAGVTSPAERVLDPDRR
jgi:hypothetical protein